MNNHLSKARAAQESGLVSLDSLAAALSACWTIGAFGRQRLYILSGKFGPEQRFCSRYVVYPESGPEQPQANIWRFCLLNGQQDYTKGRLDILQDRIAELPDPKGLLEHSVVLGTAETARLAQQECVTHAIAAGNGKAEVSMEVASVEVAEEAEAVAA
ncbi:MAG: hypothetical protein ACRYFS_06980 [Janthinobacterium lividum]